MAAGLPSGIKVEVEFSAGVWSDVTGWVDGVAGLVIRKGRSSPTDDVQPGVLSLTLKNDDGRFTPRSQVLKDGSAHPYYPNVRPGKRIRVTYTASGTRTRFVGKVDGFPTSFAGGRPVVALNAVDSQRQLAERDLRPAWEEAVLALDPLVFFPLDEGSGETSFRSYGSRSDLLVEKRWAGGKALTAGATITPYAESTTTTRLNEGLTPAERTAKVGTWLQGGVGGITFPFTITAWVRSNSADNQNTLPGTPIVRVADSDGNRLADLIQESDTLNNAGSNVFPTGTFRFLAVTFTGSTPESRVYVDGALIATQSSSSAVVATQDDLDLASTLNVGGFGGVRHYDGHIGGVAIFNAELSAAEILDLYEAGVTGYAGDLTGERAARYLAWAGATLSHSGTEEIVGVQPIAGQSVTAAIQALLPTEGGGSAFYVAPDDTPTMTGRGSRAFADPALTLSAPGDLGETMLLGYGDEAIVNDATAERPDGLAVRIVDASSVADFGQRDASVTVYPLSDDSVRFLAEAIVVAGAEPGIRLSQVSVDCLTAETSHYATVASIGIGSRIRVTDLPSTAPRDYLEVHVEGWTETIGVGVYRIDFDTSPADVVAGVVLDEDVYGRAASDDGAMTLTSSISASATSISVTTASGPTLSTDSADYPLTLAIGEEELVVSTAPGSSTSPQTVTVSRAARGTRAAAQSSGSSVRVASDPILGL